MKHGIETFILIGIVIAVFVGVIKFDNSKKADAKVQTAQRVIDSTAMMQQYIIQETAYCNGRKNFYAETNNIIWDDIGRMRINLATTKKEKENFIRQTKADRLKLSNERDSSYKAFIQVLLDLDKKKITIDLDYKEDIR